jgi:hypothetical protein
MFVMNILNHFHVINTVSIYSYYWDELLNFEIYPPSDHQFSYMTNLLKQLVRFESSIQYPYAPQF